MNSKHRTKGAKCCHWQQWALAQSRPEEGRGSSPQLTLLSGLGLCFCGSFPWLTATRQCSQLHGRKRNSARKPDVSARHGQGSPQLRPPRAPTRSTGHVQGRRTAVPQRGSTSQGRPPSSAQRSAPGGPSAMAPRSGTSCAARRVAMGTGGGVRYSAGLSASERGRAGPGRGVVLREAVRGTAAQREVAAQNRHGFTEGGAARAACGRLRRRRCVNGKGKRHRCRPSGLQKSLSRGVPQRAALQTSEKWVWQADFSVEHLPARRGCAARRREGCGESGGRTVSICRAVRREGTDSSAWLL